MIDVANDNVEEDAEFFHVTGEGLVNPQDFVDEVYAELIEDEEQFDPAVVQADPQPKAENSDSESEFDEEEGSDEENEEDDDNEDGGDDSDGGDDDNGGDDGDEGYAEGDGGNQEPIVPDVQSKIMWMLQASHKM